MSDNSIFGDDVSNDSNEAVKDNGLNFDELTNVDTDTDEDNKESENLLDIASISQTTEDTASYVDDDNFSDNNTTEESISINEDASPKEEEIAAYNETQAKKSLKKVLKNKKGADKLKRQTIFTVIIVVFLSLFLLTVLNIRKPKQKTKNEDIKSAGNAYIPNFEAMAENSYNKEAASETVPDLTVQGESDEELIARMKEEAAQYNNEVRESPVKQEANNIRSGGGSGGRRKPDTRDNYIQKQITGIKGLTPTGRQNRNTSNISSQNSQHNSGQSNNPYAQFGLPPKQEMIQRMMNMQGMQGSFLDKTQQDQAGKERFYDKNLGSVSDGEFLNAITLWQGTIIPAVLITAINTDLPGNIIARVTKNVYSSLDGRFLLIPQGTLLFANYNSSVSYAQNRVQVGWTHMIRPDGFFVELGNMSGVDTQGQSGYKGRVNYHLWEFIKGLLLVSSISVFDTEIKRLPNDITNDPYFAGLKNNLQAPYQKIAGKIIDRALDIQPTIRVKSGISINILTNANMTLPPMQMPEVTQKYIRY